MANVNRKPLTSGKNRFSHVSLRKNTVCHTKVYVENKITIDRNGSAKLCFHSAAVADHLIPTQTPVVGINN